MTTTRSPTHRTTSNVGADRVRAALTRIPRSAFLASVTGSPNAPAGVLQQPPAPQDVAETMLKALELRGSERVLEIGSGSVYETALLSQLADSVVSLDATPESAETRLRLLSILGCPNVRVVVGPGGAGWPNDAPYQAILVAGGASRLPVVLLDQLEVGGRLVVPLGDANGQILELTRKRVDGIVSEALGPCHLPMLPWARRPSSFPWAGT